MASLGYDYCPMPDMKLHDANGTMFQQWGAAITGQVTALFRSGKPVDAMDMRLLNSPSAGTPPTPEELAKLEESRLQFLAGDFIVDPATTRDQGTTTRRAAASR